MTIGEKLKSARIDSAFTQEELSKRSGYSRSTISRWERGRIIPRNDELSKLSEILELPSDWFNDETERSTHCGIDASNDALLRKIDELILSMEDMKLELVTVGELKKTIRKAVIFIIVAIFIFLIGLYVYFYMSFNWPSDNESYTYVEYFSQED